MKVNTKLKLATVPILWRVFRANSIGKKIKKYDDVVKYPLPWRHNYVLKKAKKFAKTLNVDLTVEGYENLPKAPFILTPNHASSFDPALMILALENKDKASDQPNIHPVFLAKKEIEKSRRFKGFAYIISTFFIDRENFREAVEVIDQMVAHAKENKNAIIIFPEGTRSKDGSLGEFKGGAFRAAKKDFLPIVPVTINNSLAITDLSREGKHKVQVIFHPAIKPINILAMDTQAIGKMVQQKVQSKLVKPEGSRSTTESKIA